MKKRIWELDAFRGVCIIGMVAVHFLYDLSGIPAFSGMHLPRLFHIIQDWGGILFILLSGICVTLGSHSGKRGALVLLCGLLVSAVTAGVYFLHLADRSILIYFGVLHCLGVCMLLWPLFKKLPRWALPVIGIPMAVAGLILRNYAPVDFPWLIPLGIMPAGFVTSDYFPLLPHLGFFLIGAWLGKMFYAEKKTRFPGVSETCFPVRFLCACGRHSLWIYLLHQPILTVLFLIFL